MDTSEKIKAALSYFESKGMLDTALSKLEGLMADSKSTESGSKEGPCYSLVSRTNTVIKSAPIQSSQLSSEDLRKVPPGHEIMVKTAVRGESHIKFITPDDKHGYIWPPHWIIPGALKLQTKKDRGHKVATVFKNMVSDLKLSQPDSVTCQATCIAMALNTTDVASIRNRLASEGIAGDPWVMARLLGKELGDRYIFDDNASMSEMREWLRAGEFLITHGWFTGSGHVVVMDGVSVDPETLSYKFDMSDPWSEFNFKSWSYNKPNVTFYDGYYSALGIYASCVAGQSPTDGHRIYNAGKFDSSHKGAWVHRISKDRI